MSSLIGGLLPNFICRHVQVSIADERWGVQYDVHFERCRALSRSCF